MNERSSPVAANRGGTHAAPSPYRAAGRTFVAMIGGFILLGPVDFCLSSVAGAVDADFGDAVAILAVVTANAASVGIAASLGGALLAVCVVLLDRNRRRALATRFVPPFLVAVGFVALNRETFSGGWISTQSWRPAAEWSFRVLGVFGAFLLWRLVLWIATTSAGSRPLKASVAFAVLGTATVYVNATTKVGLYVMLHTQLAWAAAAFLSLATAFGLVHVGPRRAAIAAILAVFVTACGIGVRRGDSWRRLAASTLSRGRSVQYLAPLAAPMFDRFSASGGAPRAIEPVEIPSEDVDARAVIDRWLDANVPQRRSMNVLLVAVDTLRADHVGFLGYGRNVTPNLDRLAAGAFVFSRAYTTYPTSNFAYSSVFTGLFPKASPAYSGQMQTGVVAPPRPVDRRTACVRRVDYDRGDGV